MNSRRPLTALLFFVPVFAALHTGVGMSRAAPIAAAATQPGVAAITGWPARAPMLELTCPGIRVCFAVGTLPPPVKLPAQPPAAPPGRVIAYTDDGGTRWTVHVDPHASFGGIACPNPTRCYVLTGLYRIHNATAHAQVVTVTTSVSLTSDGGKTWQQRPLPSGAGTNSAMSCPGVATCILWGYTTPGASSKAAVLITTNGGRTWKASRTVAHGRPTAARLACPTVRVCYLYGGFTGTAISVSRDGGMTWRTLPGTDMLALSGVPSRALAHMGGIACPSARVCYTSQGGARCDCDNWGPFGTIFGTQDGGNRWGRLYRAPGRDFPTGIVSCPGVSVCYAVGTRQRDVPADEIILSTKDGGRTWTAHSLPAVDISCPSAEVCYAHSYGGVVFQTADGGTTWQTLP